MVRRLWRALRATFTRTARGRCLGGRRAALTRTLSGLSLRERVRVRVQQRVALSFWIIAVNFFSAAAPAHAFTVEHSDTRYVEKQYRCELTVTIDAPLDRVEAVLRDYEQYPELDPRILQAHVLERPEPAVAMLQTTLRACFGPFCRNVKRIERVEESPGVLAATTDATRSDVKFGETRTALERIDSGSTRVTYRTTIVPGFWIPAIAGRRWMLRTLEDATSNLFMNVEAKARAEAEATGEERTE